MTPLPVASNAGIDLRGWILIAGISMAALAEAVASTAISTGRIDLIGDIHATPDEFLWLDVGYTAAKFTGFAISAWLINVLSGTVVLRFATGVLAIGCGLAALTQDAGFLTALRLLQGLAGGVLLVCGQTALFQLFDRQRQPLIQSLFATGAVVAPACFVPLMSGWIVDNWSWNWIFLTGFASGLVGLALAVAGGELNRMEAPDRGFDWPGLVLLAAAVTALTYVLNQGSRWNWFDETRIILLAAFGTAALVVFVISLFGTHKDKLIDLSVFRDQDFAFAFAVSFVAGFALTGSAYVIPSFAVSLLGMTATEAGWLLLPSGFLFIATLLLVALLIRVGRLPPIATVPFGILTFMAAMWMLSQSNAESGAADMNLAILLRGAGLGMLFLSLTLIALSGLPRAFLVYGVALFNIGRLAGGQIGIGSLQTLIDRETAQNLAVLGANLNNGHPAVISRLAQINGLLAAKGVEPGGIPKAAMSMLGRQLSNQAAVISFETAFFTIALLFVVAAPILIAYKIILGKIGGH
ncbi:MFS transporter [Rhizobium aouanii]|uniref:MFS transporter n=1 Tax=Rhizobium aouanii TaxID=3118145 RepID=A0ABU8CIJ9_9HYPH